MAATKIAGSVLKSRVSRVSGNTGFLGPIGVPKHTDLMEDNIYVNFLGDCLVQLLETYNSKMIG